MVAGQGNTRSGTGRDPVALGSAHPMNAPYAAFRCRDGYFALAAGTNKLWEATCAGIGFTQLAADARFATPTLRAKNQDALRDLLEVEFTKRDAAELLAIFSSRGVPCAPINSYSQVLADPQVEHMGWVEHMTLPGGEDPTIWDHLGDTYHKLEQRDKAVEAWTKALEEAKSETRPDPKLIGRIEDKLKNDENRAGELQPEKPGAP